MGERGEVKLLIREVWKFSSHLPVFFYVPWRFGIHSFIASITIISLLWNTTPCFSAFSVLFI